MALAVDGTGAPVVNGHESAPAERVTTPLYPAGRDSAPPRDPHVIEWMHQVKTLRQDRAAAQLAARQFARLNAQLSAEVARLRPLAEEAVTLRVAVAVARREKAEAWAATMDALAQVAEVNGMVAAVQAEVAAFKAQMQGEAS